MPTLLDYLSQPNLQIDSTSLLPGSNREVDVAVEINGTEPWPEFSYDNVMRCFGDILTVNLPENRFVRPPAIRPHLLSI